MNVKVDQKNPDWIEKLVFRLKMQAAGLEAAVGYPAGKEGLAGPHYPTTQSVIVKENRARKKAKQKPLKVDIGTGPSILEVAIWNNFGVPGHIERRPFMDLAAGKMQAKYKEMTRKAVKRVNSGGTTIKAVLEAAGKMGAGEVRMAIREGGWADNKSPYKELKEKHAEGEVKPLIDSGDLMKFATHHVRPRTR